jgi:hypothetical protein
MCTHTIFWVIPTLRGSLFRETLIHWPCGLQHWQIAVNVCACSRTHPGVQNWFKQHPTMIVWLGYRPSILLSSHFYILLVEKVEMVESLLTKKWCVGNNSSFFRILVCLRGLNNYCYFKIKLILTWCSFRKLCLPFLQCLIISRFFQNVHVYFFISRLTNTMLIHPLFIVSNQDVQPSAMNQDVQPSAM